MYNDEFLSIRMMILRKHVILYDLQVRIQAFSGGEIMDLPLSPGTTGYARWTGVFPLTMKHNIDENSPITKKGMDKITNMVAVTVTAIDSDGKPGVRGGGVLQSARVDRGSAGVPGLVREEGVLP